MAIAAAESLGDEGISAELLEISTIKPIDDETLVTSASKTGGILTVEEHNACGGLGSAVAESLGKHCPAKMDFVGIDDTFTESGPYAELMAKHGISVKDIVEKARALVAQ
jgi:transketolase